MYDEYDPTLTDTAVLTLHQEWSHTKVANYTFKFKLKDSNPAEYVAPDVVGRGVVGTQVSYNTANKPIYEFYPEYRGNIEISGQPSGSITLSDNDSTNELVFEYTEKTTKNYTINFKLQGFDTDVADPITGSAPVGDTVVYNAETKPATDFYEIYRGKVYLQEPKSYDIEIVEDESKNIHTFYYSEMDGATEVAYTVNYVLNDASNTPVADQLTGTGNAGSSMTFTVDDSGTNPVFNAEYQNKLIMPKETSQTKTLDSDTSQNVFTFVFVLDEHGDGTDDDIVKYSVNFELEDGTPVADSVEGYDYVGETVTYDVNENPPSLYHKYTDKITLKNPSETSKHITLVQDEASNQITFVYTVSNPSENPRYLFEFRFQLQDGTPVAPSVYGKDFEGQEETYNIEEEPPAFYPYFSDSLQLIGDENVAKIIVSDNEKENIYTFYYEPKSDCIGFEWHFELADGTEVAPVIKGADKVGNVAYYNAMSKSDEDYYPGFSANTIQPPNPEYFSYSLKDNESQNVRTFIYTLKSNKTTYE